MKANKVILLLCALMLVGCNNGGDKEDKKPLKVKEHYYTYYDNLEGTKDEYKDVYTYNDKGLETNIQSYWLNDETKEYEATFRYEYTYDSNDNLLTAIVLLSFNVSLGFNS